MKQDTKDINCAIFFMFAIRCTQMQHAVSELQKPERSPAMWNRMKDEEDGREWEQIVGGCGIIEPLFFAVFLLLLWMINVWIELENR